MTGFYHPELLILLISVPIIYFAYRQALKKRRLEAIAFSAVSFAKSALGDKKKSVRHNLLFYLSLAAIILIIVGFADPHIPLLRAQEGVNVVLVLDTSGSMQATDYKPTRLDAAKSAAKILIDSLKPNDNVGIVTFEAGATTAAYLSPFKDKVNEKLTAIAPKQGSTAIGDGLILGIDMATSVPNKKKVIVLLSDGVNNAGVVSPQDAVAYAKKSKIQVYSIGLGSNGNVILGYDWFGNPQYAELDEKTLQSIARETGASYFKSVDSTTLDDIYKNIGQDIKREKEETSIKDWLFASALLVLIAQLYFRYGKYRIMQ